MFRIGEYEIIKKIASGGMGSVYVARKEGLQGFSKLVAIKQMHPYLELGEDARRRFAAEARIGAALAHPNIIDVQGFASHEQEMYMVMEYVHGFNLRALMKARKGEPLPARLAALILREVLSGLEASHGYRTPLGEPEPVIHRDLNPRNILVSEAGQVKVTDFGVALIPDQTRGTSLKGTFAYMSPEQANGQPLDHRTDIYSAGIVLYEIITGRRVYQGSSEMETLRLAQQGLASQLPVDGVPEPLQRAIRRALELDAGRRFADAKSFREALDDYLDGAGRPTREDLAQLVCPHLPPLTEVLRKSVQVPRRQTRVVKETPSESPRSGQPTGKRSRAWIIGLGLLSVLVLGVALALWMTREKSTTSRRAVIDDAGAAVSVGGVPDMAIKGEALRVGLGLAGTHQQFEQEWQPFLRYLQAQLERPVELVMTHTQAQLINAFGRGEVDLIHLTAYAYLSLRRVDPAVHPLAMAVIDGQIPYRSYLVAPKRRPYSRLTQLKGKRVCYVDEKSTSGYIAPRLMLRQAGLNEGSFFASEQLSGAPLNALQDLLAGRCDVAAVASTIFEVAPDRGISTDGLRVLARSPVLPRDVFCASSRLERKLLEALGDALLGLDAQRDLGGRWLNRTFGLTGFAPVDEKELQRFEQRLPPRPATARRRPVRRSGMGTLVLNTLPTWSRVWIDGKPYKTTPLTVRLPRGRHLVLLRPAGKKEPRRFWIDIRAGRTTKRIITLD